MGTRTLPLVEQRADGSIFLKSAAQLRPYPRSLTDRLEEWGRKTPAAVFLAERGPSGEWQTLTYADAWNRTLRVAQGLLDRGVSVDRPVAILSGNSLEHALVELACLHIGVPVAPISPAYSLLSSDHARLKSILALLEPGLVFADSGAAFAPGIEAAVQPDAKVVVGDGPVASHRCELLATLESDPPGPQVQAAHSNVAPDTVAKLLFTSGSTGQPKGVINTHKMLSSNQQGIAQAIPFLAQEPPVLVDWLPWHHTFGGNHNFGIALYNGGSLYIDDGKPVGNGMLETVRNLREIAPTIYFNVPKGFEMLIPFLRADPKFRDHFFSKMKALFYAAAAMSAHTWEALCELSRESLRFTVPIFTGIGSTETSPALSFTNGTENRPGLIGFPLAGIEVKLAPVGPKLELRAKGPNIMPGYWRDAEKNQAAFDEEGYYCMGDAVRLADPQDPSKGLEFNGRIAEDFKLSSGTWVNVGPLRLRIIEFGAPLVRDVVIAGHDRDYLSALIIPDVEGCRGYCDDLPAGATPGEILADSGVREEFRKILSFLAAKSTGTANRIVRAILLEEPLSADAGEITDKGAVNQRAVIDRRAALVEECYEALQSPRVLCIGTAE